MILQTTARILYCKGFWALCQSATEIGVDNRDAICIDHGSSFTSVTTTATKTTFLRYEQSWNYFRGQYGLFCNCRGLHCSDLKNVYHAIAMRVCSPYFAPYVKPWISVWSLVETVFSHRIIDYVHQGLKYIMNQMFGVAIWWSWCLYRVISLLAFITIHYIQF